MGRVCNGPSSVTNKTLYNINRSFYQTQKRLRNFNPYMTYIKNTEKSLLRDISNICRFKSLIINKMCQHWTKKIVNATKIYIFLFCAQLFIISMSYFRNKHWSWKTLNCYSFSIHWPLIRNLCYTYCIGNMANIAAARIQREFKEVVKSEEVQIEMTMKNYWSLTKNRTLLYRP